MAQRQEEMDLTVVLPTRAMALHIRSVWMLNIVTRWQAPYEDSEACTKMRTWMAILKAIN